MKGRSTIYLFGLLGITALGGCTMLRSTGQPSQSLPATPITSSPPANPAGSDAPDGQSGGPEGVAQASTPAAQSPTPSPNTLPDSRIMPMTIEGQPVELELQLFDQSALPFTTYVPKRDFQNEIKETATGTVAQFFFSPSGKKDHTAYVQIFMPARQMSVDNMRELLIGQGGLLSTNRWELVDRTDIVSYPWAREKLIYQQRTPQQNFVGSIYIGDYKGRSFYALTHYPTEYLEGFEPRSTVMLENLQFRDERP